jgi:hypothetical protein
VVPEQLFPILLRLIIAAILLMAVPAMAAMHEHVHERTRQDHQKRQGRSHMLLMPDDEVATDNYSNRKEGHTFRSSKATEHHQGSFFLQ